MCIESTHVRREKKVALKTRVKIWHFCLKRFEFFLFLPLYLFSSFSFYEKEATHYKLLISNEKKNMDGKMSETQFFSCLLPFIWLSQRVSCILVCVCVCIRFFFLSFSCYWFCDACARSKHLTTAHQQEENKIAEQQKKKKNGRIGCIRWNCGYSVSEINREPERKKNISSK